jgi:transaldolase/glucose-6-phosphate isomerase
MSKDCPHQTLRIGDYQNFVDKRLKSWREINFNRRLWEKDSTLWFSEPVPEIADRLDWLTLPEMMHEQLEALVSFAEEVKNDGMRHIILLGMGGSSLAPAVFQNTFGNAPGYPELIVLDSTHPDAVLTVEEKIDLRHSLFIVASKSGTTLETLSFFRYFWKKVGELVDSPEHQFIAITDPGSPLAQLAHEKGFRHVFLAPTDIGGRYSALSVFGLVPAALMGADVHKLLDRARIGVADCSSHDSEQCTSGLTLGATLGELAKRGRDKITFLTLSPLKSFPRWLEQLIAESTGKDSKGILPLVSEPLVDSESYGNDRFFVYFNLDDTVDQNLEKKIEELEAAGHPTACIALADGYDIGREIFRWEIAVASAASILGVHPFNQPDVELAKEFARQMMEKKIETEGVETVSGDDRTALAESLNDWLANAREGGYAAVQAYLSPTEEVTELLHGIRMELLNRLGLATTVGYGPRFLHSTGQLHKGGPNTGLFLQIVDGPVNDAPVPEADYTFGEIIHAQGIGDYQALKKREREVLRVDLKKDVTGGLSRISELLHHQGTERI